MIPRRSVVHFWLGHTKRVVLLCICTFHLSKRHSRRTLSLCVCRLQKQSLALEPTRSVWRRHGHLWAFQSWTQQIFSHLIIVQKELMFISSFVWRLFMAALALVLDGEDVRIQNWIPEVVIDCHHWSLSKHGCQVDKMFRRSKFNWIRQCDVHWFLSTSWHRQTLNENLTGCLPKLETGDELVSGFWKFVCKFSWRATRSLENPYVRLFLDSMSRTHSG